MDDDDKEYYAEKLNKIASMKFHKEACETLLDSTYSLYIKSVKANKQNKKIDK